MSATLTPRQAIRKGIESDGEIEIDFPTELALDRFVDSVADLSVECDFVYAFRHLSECETKIWFLLYGETKAGQYMMRLTYPVGQQRYSGVAMVSTHDSKIIYL